jgi:hypothetical protein
MAAFNGSMLGHNYKKILLLCACTVVPQSDVD